MHFLNHKLPTYADKCDRSTLILARKTADVCLLVVIVPWVGVKNFGFTEEQKNIEQGSTKLKELHVCIMRVQKKMAAWRSEVP